MGRLVLLGIGFAATASPAWAQAPPVSEPSDLALFALGVIGIVIGRQAARRKP